MTLYYNNNNKYYILKDFHSIKIYIYKQYNYCIINNNMFSLKTNLTFVRFALHMYIERIR